MYMNRIGKGDSCGGAEHPVRDRDRILNSDKSKWNCISLPLPGQTGVPNVWNYSLVADTNVLCHYVNGTPVCIAYCIGI